MYPFNVTYLLIAYLLITLVSSFYEIFIELTYFYAKRPNVSSALHTGYAKLYDFSTIGNTSSTGPDLWPSSSLDHDLTLV